MLYSEKEELDTKTLETDIYNITAVTGNTAVVQLSDGCLVTAAVTAGQLEVEDTGTKWPAVCSTVLSSDQGILGLTDRFQLYLDNKQLGTNVTSIQLHSCFLLMTTLDHQLLTLPLDKLDSAATAAKRRVERGSRLVVSVHHDSKTVLQMPRGNIEVIHPRSLSIVLLSDLLNNSKYK